MNFILGLIIGLLIASLIFIILAFFRAGIEKRIIVIEKKLEQAGPKIKGAIYMPEDPAEEARREYIKREHKKGRDVRFEELE
jgi:hypothetical protein